MGAVDAQIERAQLRVRLDPAADAGGVAAEGEADPRGHGGAEVERLGEEVAALDRDAPGHHPVRRALQRNGPLPAQARVLRADLTPRRSPPGAFSRPHPGALFLSGHLDRASASGPAGALRGARRRA